MFDGKDRPLGLQLYMLGNEFGRDTDRMFTELAAAGYTRIEADWAIVSRAGVLEAAARHGLTCNSVHVSPMALGTGDGPAIDKLAADIAAKGIGFAGIPIFPFSPSLLKNNRDPMPVALARIGAGLTGSDWRDLATTFNRCGEVFSRHGLRFFYHNHNVEFRPVDGTTPLEILIGETDPALVSFEFDAGWVAAAGLDPVAILRKHKNRFRLMHVKDIAKGTVPNFAFDQLPATVGAGTINWGEVIPAARAAGITEFLVEQEPPYSGPRIDAARTSASYLLGATG
jgi:sugar phosphate isomerase/epimerase